MTLQAVLTRHFEGSPATHVVAGIAHGSRREYAVTGAAAVSPDIAFRIASLTKPFTAASTVLACREAEVPLDTPVRDLLPDLEPDWRAEESVTVRQLLGQVAGFSPTVGSVEVAALGSGEQVHLRAARLVVAAGQVRSPGERWEYYNGNYFVAGALLARLSGTTYEDAVRRYVLSPWGLACSGFEEPAQFAPGLAGGVAVSETGYPRGRRPSGGLWSTVPDLLEFTEGLRGVPGLLAELRRPVTRSDDEMAYGLGWAIGPSGQMYLNGRLPGYRALMMALPDHEWSMVVLANDATVLDRIAAVVSELQAQWSGDDLSRALEDFAA